MRKFQAAFLCHSRLQHLKLGYYTVLISNIVKTSACSSTETQFTKFSKHRIAKRTMHTAHRTMINRCSHREAVDAIVHGGIIRYTPHGVEELQRKHEAACCQQDFAVHISLCIKLSRTQQV